MNKYVVCTAVLFSLLSPVASPANDEDPFGDYLHDINKPAEANAINVYQAWGNNMAHRIKNGYSDGIVIDGPGEYANGAIKVDGLGNVVVDEDAIVGPIINNTELRNTTVITNPNKRKW